MRESLNVKTELTSLGKTFIITTVVAFMITNSENFIFSVLDNVGLTNDVFKKTVLSAVVTLGIGVVRLLLLLISTAVVKNLEVLKIKIVMTCDGKEIRNPIEFDPVTAEYEEQEINLKVSFEPRGKINIFIMKYIGIVVNIYFNPKILDIYFSNGWEGIDPSFEISDRSIKINLLSQLSISGKRFFGRKHVLSESFLIKPIRVHDSETYLDYDFSARKHGMISKLFTKKIELDYKTIDIICKGVR
ncbi:hypothetical protein P7D52_05335 [Enterococcus dongliensis]|uniref:Uncharacterized protein n=1 Tax=Enterococcus dongliensis TaxID=2559925 RepID=A0AAW8TKC4_9ENTE|nr:MULTISPECIES: hypothetical protein [Enterococcus]MDT2635142.1 hypothetical protein [Enterococcus dongliensis]MDT2636590.1 hypothetical protein [Enterococcus dongliensis]MDT2642237.1 hypothetical protein [Enterococcus dongliensis]WCG32196.1 hypothetical protein PML78_08295 [Enterococcus dispar]